MVILERSCHRTLGVNEREDSRSFQVPSTNSLPWCHVVCSGTGCLLFLFKMGKCKYNMLSGCIQWASIFIHFNLYFILETKTFSNWKDPTRTFRRKNINLKIRTILCFWNAQWTKPVLCTLKWISVVINQVAWNFLELFFVHMMLKNIMFPMFCFGDE